MRELQAEVTLAGDWSDEPVRTAHLWSNLAIFHAEDASRALAHLFDGEWTPVFAHVTLGRSAVEACARARWMLEPDIGAERRVGRHLANEKHAFAERLQFPAEADPHRDRDAREHQKRMDGAQARGLLTETRPRYTDVIDLLFRGPTPADDREMGAAIAGLWAGVAHGGLHALRPSLEVGEAEFNVVTGTPSVPVVTRSNEVAAVIAIVMLGYISSAWGSAATVWVARRAADRRNRRSGQIWEACLLAARDLDHVG